jgi:hypothetical protein
VSITLNIKSSESEFVICEHVYHLRLVLCVPNIYVEIPLPHRQIIVKLYRHIWWRNGLFAVRIRFSLRHRRETACLSQRRGQLQATIRWYPAKTVVERLLQLCSIFILIKWKQSMEWMICTGNIFSLAQDLVSDI